MDMTLVLYNIILNIRIFKILCVTQNCHQSKDAGIVEHTITF